MKIDFTFKIYTQLLKTALDYDYKIISFEKFLSGTNGLEKTIILRHDVDKKPENSFKVALIEKQLGVISSYYFRIVKKSNKPDIIKKIANLGHEIGYHYEDLSLNRGDYQKAIESFQRNLNYFRNYYPVKTICMHGSPLSKWDNKLIWDKTDYKNYGIIGEPYYDIDFNEFLYLTDTGRRWDGQDTSVRDKVGLSIDDCRSSEILKQISPDRLMNEKNDEENIILTLQNRYKFHSTNDIIRAAERNRLPDKIMLTTHPQRWNDSILSWTREFIMQNLKNIVKKNILVKQH